jgi:8-oxo-dGTP pyrophosphatase MutT (NUDIX family)
MNKEYVKRNKNSYTKFTYFSKKEFPRNVPISTPLTFAFVGENLILTKKKNGWWDILGGKIENNESWEDALKREAQEEAGVEIDFIEIVGYVLAENFGDKKETIFEGKTILPITMSFVQKIDRNWKALETLGREIFNRENALKELLKREDNGQLAGITKNVFDFFKKQKYKYNFKYFPAENKGDFSEITTTQTMAFILSEDKKFYLVKDFGEEFYSIPGGGCFLNESDEECAKREIMEEAQFEVDNLILLGVVLVEVKKGDLVLSKTKQLRYLAKAKEVFDFKHDERKEIEERALADFDFMKNNVKLLKNKTGEEILEDLKNKL